MFHHMKNASLEKLAYFPDPSHHISRQVVKIAKIRVFGIAERGRKFQNTVELM